MVMEQVMDIEAILMEAYALGIREEVIELARVLQRKHPHDLKAAYEEAYQTITEKVS
jgi:hypothetical protein